MKVALPGLQVAPPPSGRLARLAHGFLLPFAIFRASLGDPALRRSYLRVCSLQTAATAVIGAAAVWEGVVELPSGLQAMDGSWWHRGLVLFGIAFAAVQLAQLLVIGLSRDFHTQLSNASAMQVGLVPEDPDARPRLRINWKWIRRRVQRRWRTVVLVAMAAPVLYPPTLFLPYGERLFSALMSLWGGYWWVVFTAGKSARAWVNAEQPSPPFFIRAMDWTHARIPPLRWMLTGWLGRLWVRFSRPVWSPAGFAEQHPWSFSGLALAKALGSLPILKLWLRPVFSVSSAWLLVENGAEHGIPDQLPRLGADAADVGAALAAEPGKTDG